MKGGTKVRGSKIKYGVFFVCLVPVMMAAFIHSASLSETGEFLSEFLTKEGVEMIDVNKIDVRSDDIFEQKVLNKDERERLAHYLSNQDFKIINSDATEYNSTEGYLIEGRDRQGDLIFSMKSYGDEFIVGYTVAKNSQTEPFKLKIKDDNWLNNMECFLL